MSQTTSSGASPDAGIDLSQFYEIFFQEAAENLERMEQLLLEIDVAAADQEALNAIFRCAHSVKGGAATFGFSDVAALTHEMETLLDKLRRHELAPTAAMIDLLLASGDALRALLARHQGQGGEAIDTTELLLNISAMSGQSTALQRAPADPAERPAGKPGQEHGEAAQGTRELELREPEPREPELRELELLIGPLSDPRVVDDVAALFKEIDGLGTIEPIDGGTAADGVRRFRVVTASTDGDLLDLFSFHVSSELVDLRPGAASAGRTAPACPPASDATRGAAPAVSATAPAAPVAYSSPSSAPAPTPAATPVSGIESSTLRVSVEKVDQLINLVGELVITQAMLAQNSLGVEPALHERLASGLADLERNTRDLQEAVMSIRMIPMSIVFNRFPRMLRDLAKKLGKQVDFVTHGEATELDKGMVEKIIDPLTHLVRNSCDHGIETPAERLGAGKIETGTITLEASHQGGSIVIQVRDDGKGLSRDRLLAKARDKGLAAPDSMSDAEVWNLIFAPGFSTADVVTDVSGRGVGMDVVKKNITSLGGTVEIESEEGRGMQVSVRLPLTLAIMNSISVGIGDECYVLPLSSVVESFRLTPEKLRTVSGNDRVVQVRGEYLPVIELERVFDVPRGSSSESPNPVIVVVEAEGARVALWVDRILGQQQVVVKNLESNYQKIDHISGATIMGDGRVALILDVIDLIRRSRPPRSDERRATTDATRSARSRVPMPIPVPMPMPMATSTLAEARA